MHEGITTLLELAGMLLLAAALAVLGWQVHPALGLAGGGGALITASALVTKRAATPKPAPDAVREVS